MSSKNIMRKERSTIYYTIISIATLIIFFGIWELAPRMGWIPKTLLAPPSEVIVRMIDKFSNPNPDGALLMTHIWISLKEALVGYFLALFIGIPLGLAMGWFKIFEGLARPIFEIIRPIPSPAWIPLCIIWLGTGLASKAFIIFAGALVPCVINSYSGVAMTNTTYIRMAKTYGANDWQIFKDICIPSALPMVFGGLQVALAAAWTCLVAAELVGADAGLGYLITMGRRLMLPDMIILGMVMVALTGVVVTIIISIIERQLVKGMRR